jgi:putative PEP-CTERM system histidine kinase
VELEDLSLAGYLNPAVWSYGFALLAFAAFAIQLSVGWKGGGRALLLLASITLSAFWAATTTTFAIGPSWPLWRTAHVFDTLRLATAVAFLAVILLHPLQGMRERGRLDVPLFSTILVAALVLLAVGMPPPGLATDGQWPTLIFGSHLTLALLGVVLAEQVYRHSPATLRWNLRPLCLGLAGPFVLDVVVYTDALLFRALDPHFWAARGFSHALAIPLLGLAARRNRDWTFDVTVSRGVVAGSSAVLIAGVYLIVVAGSGYYVRYFGGTWGKTLQTVVFFAAFLLLGFVTVSSTFRAKLRVLVAKNFFSYRYDYREEWLKFTRTLSADDDARPIEEVCVRALADLVESTGGGLWLRREQPEGYAQVVRFNQPRVEVLESPEGALPSFLIRTGWVIEVPMARRDPSSQGAFGLPTWLDQLHDAWLIVPLLSGDDLIGFVVLEQPRVKMEVNWEVRDLLKTAGRQAASYLAMKRATEALLEARKFDAFNRMSAFVVHDLKNLVAQMQLMLRNAEKHHANPEFQRDMLETVEHVVERMNSLMKQLRSGETPYEGARPLDLGVLLRRVQATRVAGRRGLHLETVPGVIALGHEDRLERVIGHLVQNGFDAGGENPSVSVRVFREGDRAVVEVTDNGVGMSPEFVRDQLFKPFQTTKSTGMGIGAYESHQYVMSLGGRIDVQSQLGAGTRVRVVLPLLQQASVPGREEQPA